MITQGDCLEVLKTMADNSVDSVVTDPPYGWRFMGKAWDGEDIVKKSRQAKRPGETYVGKDGFTRQTRSDMAMAAGKYDQSREGNEAFMDWTELYATELLRVLKPGGHALIFCGPRTYHAMAMGVERAGFEIRDQLQWIFGQGFPKSHNFKPGWGTALKPANEPICMARKPLEKGLNIAKNDEKWGASGLNIDESRIATTDKRDRIGGGTKGKSEIYGHSETYDSHSHPLGRWPANTIIDGNVAEQLADSAKFFYCAKTSPRERNAGLDDLPLKKAGIKNSSGRGFSESDPNKEILMRNHHPTVKPLRLMSHLIKLVTQPGGLVLDPFTGSGSTGVAAIANGFKFCGIEMDADYCEIARKRIEHARENFPDKN